MNDHHDDDDQHFHVIFYGLNVRYHTLSLLLLLSCTRFDHILKKLISIFYYYYYYYRHYHHHHNHHRRRRCFYFREYSRVWCSGPLID